MKITEIPAKTKEKTTTRVAAYVRVSSDKDAAFHSLEAQTDYYQKHISTHTDWELVDIYSDNAISGTTINRPEFQRMLEDCRNGKIDLIITKSITRFARNTVILLETIRELKNLGIDCYFEKEDMHSISPDGELLLTLLAMYAEEEARSASENQKWRIKKRFEKGEPWVGRMLGYRLENRRLVIVPEEAEIVRKIYSEYLSGKGICTIVKQLIKENVPTMNGGAWTDSPVRQILLNEKYAGDMILQKTYRPDFRTKKKKINNGEVRKYYVKNSHEPIIDRETFEKAQREHDRRMEKATNFKAALPAARNLFCGVMRCGFCGRRYKHYRTSSKNYRKAIWACSSYYKFGKEICPSQAIPEDILIEKTNEVLNVDTIDRETILNEIKEILVPAHNSLEFILKDGTNVDIKWQHRSRKDSWTKEMKEAARKRALLQYRKEKHE